MNLTVLLPSQSIVLQTDISAVNFDKMIKAMTGEVDKVSCKRERCWECLCRWGNSDAVFGRRSKKVTSRAKAEGNLI